MIRGTSSEIRDIILSLFIPILGKLQKKFSDYPQFPGMGDKMVLFLISDDVPRFMIFINNLD